MPIHSGTPPGEEDRSEASAEDARQLEELRRAVQIGVEALERGHYVEGDDADLDAFLDSLTVEALVESREQVCRGELATDEEVEAAYARFRR
ncbi:MAG: hypothetical protein WAN86_06925 [Hyphomicrobiaceae bacterium]